MDLIDRSKINFYHLTGPELRSAIEEAPTVPAVPLEQLANWLAERYEPPYTLNDIDKLKALDFIQIKEIWLAALTKWMEEQDANRQ